LIDSVSSRSKLASAKVDADSKPNEKVDKKTDEDPQSSLCMPLSLSLYSYESRLIQYSLCPTDLLPSLLNTASFTDGHPTAGSGNTPSLFSPNNFINYCATRPDLELTNGTMKKQGSCNPIPMGMLMSIDKM
jgi:hypothetical protein